MNAKRIALFTLMVVAIGLFALPNIVLYVEKGWKEFPGPGPTPAPMPNQTPEPEAPYDETAAKIMAELWVGGAHRNFSCDTCHNSPIANFEFHVECMDCHGDTGNISGHWKTPECRNCSICHWIGGSDIGNYSDFISAGGFGMNASSFDVGKMAGHEDLILWAEQSDSMAGANEACIACHTNVTVNFTMPKKEYMSFDAEQI